MYTAVEGPSPAAIRSALAVMVREHSTKVLQDRCRGRADSTGRFACGYSGSLGGLGRGELDIEHVVEGQMDGHVLAYCPDPELRYRLRQVDLNLPGSVRATVFAPYHAVHNGEANLTFAGHALNMKKEGAVRACLLQLDRGGQLDAGLPRELLRSLMAPTKKGVPGRDEEEAGAVAAAIVRRLRDVEGGYVAALEGVSASDPGLAAVQGSRTAVVAMYGQLAEEVGQLYGALQL